jgi:hypothetical protein
MSNMLPSQVAPVTRVHSARPGLRLWPSSLRFLAAYGRAVAESAFRSQGVNAQTIGIFDLPFAGVSAR